MKKQALTTILLAALLLLVILPSVAFAQPSILNSLEQAGNAGFGEGTTRSLPEIIGNVIKVFLSIVGVIFLVLMVYAGYLWMTAQGEEQKVEKSKDTIKAAVIGLIIVVAAYAITNFVVSGILSAALGGTSGGSAP